MTKTRTIWLTLRSSLFPMSMVLAVACAPADPLPSGATNPPISPAGPDALAVSMDEARHLRAAIGRLTPLQQDVVVLRFLEDRSNKEIAAITGKPEATIRGIQMRALAALRDLLGAEVAR